jgi:cyclic pyranopterin phosphate synthase
MESRQPLVDAHGRTLRDLRISITDRCNFRCLYCLPETEAALNFYRGRWANMPNPSPLVHKWQPREKLLTFEEITRIIGIAASLGINKIRLTGGEPLLRNDVERLISMISPIPGIDDIALTTNGFLFQEKAEAMHEAGLKRISFSLDSLDKDNFKKMTGRDGLSKVLEGIRLAKELGYAPVKVNAVIIRGINDHEIESLALFAKAEKISMRFIEFMPLDSARAWLKDLVVTGKEILSVLKTKFDLQPAPRSNASETASRWRFADSGGEIGLISPVSEPFCGHCNRLRLTSDGNIRTCLFSITEHDLKSRLRNGDSDEEIVKFLRSVVWQKEDRHHIGEPEFVSPERSMSCIGG